MHASPAAAERPLFPSQLRQSDPALASNGRGGLAAAWVEWAQHRSQLRVAVSSDSGDHWLELPGENPLWTTTVPSLASDGSGDFWLAWTTATHPRHDERVMLARLHSTGRLDPARAVSLGDDDGAALFGTTVISHGARPVIAWQRVSLDGEDRLHAATLDSDRFAIVQVSSGEDEAGGSPSFCSSEDGTLYLISVRSGALLVHRSDDHARSWQLVARPSSDAAWQGGRCAARGHELWIVHSDDDYRGDRNEVISALRISRDHSSTLGESWDAPGTIAEGPPGMEFLGVSLAARPGLLAAVFPAGERGQAGTLELASSRDGGQSWRRKSLAPLKTFPVLRRAATWTGAHAAIVPLEKGFGVLLATNNSGRSAIAFLRVDATP